MNEQEAFKVLGWPHHGNNNEGNGWLAFRCPTAGCQSEGVAAAANSVSGGVESAAQSWNPLIPRAQRLECSSSEASSC